MSSSDVVIDGIRLKTRVNVTSPDTIYVFLHGWGSNAVSFQSLIKSGSNSISFDFPGHGESSALSEVFTMEKFADVTHTFLEKTCARRTIVLVGHSFGCRVIALLAQKKASYSIERIVFISPLFFPDVRTRIKLLRKSAHILGKGLESIGLGFLKSVILKRVGKHIGAEDYSQLTSSVMKKTFQEVITRDLTPELAVLKQPSIIVWGDNDKTVLRFRIDQAVSILQCPLAIIPSGSHFPFLEAPDSVSSHIYVSH